MAAPKVMSGARAKVGVHDPLTGETKIIGIFDNFNYGVVYDYQAAYILGRYIAAEIDYTAVEIVSISASGWRIRGHGVHVDGRLPRVQDLLFAEYLEMVVIDRQAEVLGQEARIAKLRQVRAITGGGGFSAKTLSQANISYVGILCDDESTENAEHPSAADLP
jgi:hypothetical protein